MLLPLLLQAGMFGGVAIVPEPPAVISDGKGGGGAGIIYKRPHKQIHDEVEEYFDLRTPAEAEKIIDAIAEAAREAVLAKGRASEADLRKAKSGLAAMLEERRNAELRALLAIAQDEDEAEAVLAMLELA